MTDRGVDTGIDNLEVMSKAVNDNGFLVDSTDLSLAHDCRSPADHP